MANVTISPNMNLPVPTVGVDPGPDWANNVDASLSIIDGHNHSPGAGVQITPNGININSDLSFGSNNATSVKTVRFTAQGSPIAGSSPNLGCIYVSGANLWYNDISGNQIQITLNGSVAAGSGTISGLPSGTASASYASANGTFVFQQATSTAANIDVATVIIRYPGSYPTPTGNYIALEAPSSLASGYSLTLPALPGSTDLMTLSSAGVMAATISSTNPAFSGNSIQANGANSIVSFPGASPLVVVRGYLAANGTILNGEGFHLAASTTGTYDIAFTTAFFVAPIVMAISDNSGGGQYNIVAQAGLVSTTSATFYISNAATNALTNYGFWFIAIGVR